MNPFRVIRERYHPLFHLRRNPLFRRVSKWLDIPKEIRVPLVPHPLTVSLSKHLSLVLTGEGGGQIDAVERDAFVRFIQSSQFRSMIDVGANVGLYGFLFRALTGGDVTFIEADPDNANLLRRTIERNKLPVRFEHAAASDSSGTVTFYTDQASGATGSIGGSETSFVESHGHGETKPVTIRAIRLDDLECNADFLKIDVEGAELKVLRGAENLIRRCSPAILFECDSTQDEVLAFFADRNYKVFQWPGLTPGIGHNSLAIHASKLK